MLLGPLFRIELVTMPRRARYYVLRAVYGLLLLLVMWCCFAATFEAVPTGVQLGTIQAAALFGERFLYSFASLQVTAAMIVTAAVTAGTIAEERERRTIEYLFATSLTNAEIVLGKLASRLLHVVVFLATAVPVLAITLLFGGVDAMLLVQIFVVTVSTVVVTAAISIAISIWTPRPRNAITRAFIFLLGLVLIPVFAVSLAMLNPTAYAWVGIVNNELLAANPFMFLMTNATQRPMPGVLINLGWLAVLDLVRNHAMASLAMIGLAVWRVRRVHQHAVGRGGRPAKAGRSGWSWRPVLGDRPMLWKEMFAEPALGELTIVGRIVVAGLFLAVLAPLTITFYRCCVGTYPRDTFQDMAATLGSTLASLFLLVLGARAAGSVTTEREKQCWDTLLSTPLTPLEIVLGKTAGNIYSMRWMIALFALIWAMAAVLLPYCFWLGLWSCLTVAIVSPFFSCLGLWFSLRCRGSTRAMCWSLFASVVLGGGYLMLASPIARDLIGLTSEQHRWVYVACPPWLLSWPGWYDPRYTQRWAGDCAPLVYVTGLALYALAGLLMFAVNVRSFDRCSGRISLLASRPANGAKPRASTAADRVPAPSPFALAGDRP